jgi:hypothetical protein
MDVSFIQNDTIAASAGALGLKLLELAEIRNLPPERRPNLKDIIYWASYVIMPLLGGGLAYIYIISDISLKPILAMNIGISAPLILRTMAQSAQLSPPVIDPGRGA